MPEPKYGLAPIDLGLVDLTPKEMMFWLYCPVKIPGYQSPSIPDNLMQFRPILDLVRHDCADLWVDDYIYITAKTLWVSKESPGNRPGWHSDGFMTDDLNYIWSDRNGTEFWQPMCTRSFTQDHKTSLIEMGFAADSGPVVTYPDKHLLRLDETVIHRVAEQSPPGMRTFVKVSVSKCRYDLIGNSVNHAMPAWAYKPRQIERNHPSSDGK